VASTNKRSSVISAGTLVPLSFFAGGAVVIAYVVALAHTVQANTGKIDELQTERLSLEAEIIQPLPLMPR
jgi:hypothetical protein